MWWPYVHRTPGWKMCLAVRVGHQGASEEIGHMLGNMKTDGGQRTNPAAAKSKC